MSQKCSGESETKAPGCTKGGRRSLARSQNRRGEENVKKKEGIEPRMHGTYADRDV